MTIDPLRRGVLLSGRRIESTPGEFAVLQMLAEHPGRVFERAQLLRRVKAAEGYVTPRTIDTHVAHLRRKLEVDPSNPQHIYKGTSP